MICYDKQGNNLTVRNLDEQGLLLLGDRIVRKECRGKQGKIHRLVQDNIKKLSSDCWDFPKKNELGLSDKSGRAPIKVKG